MPIWPALGKVAMYAAPFIAKGIDILGANYGAGKQAAYNMELARYQNRFNARMIRQQLEYDTPANQRKRMEEAGYNPHLFYGQGTPGNQGTPQKSAPIQPADFQTAFMNIGTDIARMRLMNAQTDLTTQKTEESGTKQDLMSAQRNLINANPYMRKEYVDAMVLQLQSAAKLKEQEAGFMLSKTQDDASGVRWERGFLKMQRELDLMYQKMNLNAADQKVKAEIIQSKDFQNQLLELQRNWMKDADITPQHIYQGIMLILGKLMSR